MVETAGRPPSDFIDEFKANDISIIHKCVTARHAKSAVRMGADAISLDGFECAGHPGEEDIGNFILQAMGARELEVPYVCSGGVGNGAQLAAVPKIHVYVLWMQDYYVFFCTNSHTHTHNNHIGTCTGRGRYQYGHSLHGHRGGSHTPEHQAGSRRRRHQVRCKIHTQHMQNNSFSSLLIEI